MGYYVHQPEKNTADTCRECVGIVASRGFDRFTAEQIVRECNRRGWEHADEIMAHFRNPGAGQAPTNSEGSTNG